MKSQEVLVKITLGKSKLVFLIIIIKNKYLLEIGLKAIWPKHICKGGHKALDGRGESMVHNGSIASQDSSLGHQLERAFTN